MSCQPLNFFRKIAEVIGVEFVSTKVWVVIGIELFKGMKSSFFYSRSRTPRDFVETPRTVDLGHHGISLKLQELGHEGRRGRWIGACGSRCPSATVREIHAPGVFLILLSSFHVFFFSSTAPTALQIFPTLRGLILLG